MPFAASALYRELKGRFGAENIFFDAGTLRPGMEFLEEITSRLSGMAGAFLALIGPEWLPTMEAHRRRGDNDYVAQEIDLGMRNGWTVIPVLLNDAPLPEGRDLPLAIKALPRHHVARCAADQPGRRHRGPDRCASTRSAPTRAWRNGRGLRRRSRDPTVRVDPGDGRASDLGGARG